jgi:ATP-dependent protease ClpP protease subunit
VEPCGLKIFPRFGPAPQRTALAIMSDIGAWGATAQQFHASLKALGAPSQLRISIASDGGDLFTGFAIFNMLHPHPASKVVRDRKARGGWRELALCT